jgi:hypothetical protein
MEIIKRAGDKNENQHDHKQCGEIGGLSRFVAVHIDDRYYVEGSAPRDGHS